MGATGSGKSTFINLISGSGLGVSAGLRSCTAEVQPAVTFDLSGHRVALIDTPGFDDTKVSDTDILTMIAAFLGTSYKDGKKLSGVLYFHRISDMRMGGSSTRNVRMLQKLCGDDTLKNVIIVTNMWEQIDPRLGEAREKELMNDDDFFKPILAQNAQMVRHMNNLSSARAIISRVLKNQPLPLRIQTELIDEKKDISQTGAAKEVNAALDAQIKKHEKEVLALKEEKEQAIREGDERAKKQIEVDTKKMLDEILKYQNDKNRIEADYKKEKEAYEARLAQGQKKAKKPWFGVEYTLGGRSFGLHLGSRPAS